MLLFLSKIIKYMITTKKIDSFYYQPQYAIIIKFRIRI